MKTLKGPAIFLAQFMADEEPFDSIESMAKWAADLGFLGIQEHSVYRRSAGGRKPNVLRRVERNCRIARR